MRKPDMLITCLIPSQQWSVVEAASSCGAVSQQQGQEDWSRLKERWTGNSTEKSSVKTWSRALRTEDLAEGSPSNGTMTLITQPRQRRRGLVMILWILSWLARALTWNTLDLLWGPENVHLQSPSNLTEFEWIFKELDRKSQNPGVQSFLCYTEED